MHRPRVLLFDPYGGGEIRGNSVSTARLVRGIESAGCAVRRLVSLKCTLSAALRVAADFRPDVVHAIHAFRAGPMAREVAVRLRLPLIVSFRGTDAEAGLEDPCLRPLVERAVRSSQVLTTLTADQAERVRSAFPELAAPIRVIPHGVDIGRPRTTGIRAELGVADDAPLVVHVAGLRREKGFPAAWELVDALRAAIAGLRYVHVGPVLDHALAAGADAWFAARPWAVRLGGVPRARALDVTAAATCTLHASTVEGLSNALLESLALGVPAVARDLPASRAVIEDGVHGLIFRTDAEAVAAARRLCGDPALRSQMAAAGRALVAERFSCEAETRGYMTTYIDAIAARATGAASGVRPETPREV